MCLSKMAYFQSVKERHLLAGCGGIGHGAQDSLGRHVSMCIISQHVSKFSAQTLCVIMT